MIDNDDTVEVDLSDVSLNFGEDDRYIFYSTLDEEERGSYRIADGYIYKTASEPQALPEEAIAIVDLTPQTLVLGMRSLRRPDPLRSPERTDTVDRRMYFVRATAAQHLAEAALDTGAHEVIGDVMDLGDTSLIDDETGLDDIDLDDPGVLDSLAQVIDD